VLWVWYFGYIFGVFFVVVVLLMFGLWSKGNKTKTQFLSLSFMLPNLYPLKLKTLFLFVFSFFYLKKCFYFFIFWGWHFRFMHLHHGLKFHFLCVWSYGFIERERENLERERERVKWVFHFFLVFVWPTKSHQFSFFSYFLQIKKVIFFFFSINAFLLSYFNYYLFII